MISPYFNAYRCHPLTPIPLPQRGEGESGLFLCPHLLGGVRCGDHLCFTLFLVLVLSVPRAATAAGPLHYQVDLTSPETHLVRVKMDIPDAPAGTEIQIPTWNALYQIRDFVKNVEDLKGDCDGQPAALVREDLNTWRGPNQACRDLVFRYSVYAAGDGPFDSALDSHHSFLNLAMILFYLPHERQRPVQVKYQVPDGWKLATFLEGDGPEFSAFNYDALVDSPAEAGHFADFSYPQDFTPPDAPTTEARRATIRVIIDADRADYSPGRILSSLQKITAMETALMQDLPFRQYTFLLHFPREGGSTGGMEHRDGTAITISASSLRDHDGYLESVAAHEFFHAWNVKRIRPQSLEPVDYVHGNDTRDLWWSEGVTNTYAQLTLLRAGLIDRPTFYARVADAIQMLQRREARHSQSAETSGREAWLEKYSDYNRPDRSISYYNKGELLGYLLDLGLRHATQNQAGLDDLMRRLNQDFARRGRFYTRADLRDLIAQLAPTFDVDRFFADYVQGTQGLDYPPFLGFAGLNLTTRVTESALHGFSASRNSAGLLQVDSVDDGSGAQRAGLQVGDVLLRADGDPLPGGANPALPYWRPGQAVEIHVARQGREHDLKFRVGVNQQVSYQIAEDPQATPEQLRVRSGWLTGVANSLRGNR